MIADRGGTAIHTLHYQRPAVPTQPVRLLPRPALLAGRDGLLAELHAMLTEEDQPWPRIVVLSGLGGVGKTSAAVEYAYQYLSEVGVAWQVAAEDQAVLAAGLADLAGQLGARNPVDIRDPVASAHAVLARFPKRWLLIYDNAPDEESVRAFLPPAGRGQVLVTSQSPLWPGRVLHVPELEPDVAATFLVNRTGIPDQGAVTVLVI